MPRPRRRLQSNLVYHIYNRRTDKQCLFPEENAYEDLLGVVRRANERYAARLHAYCFLHTHVHFALSAEDPDDLVSYVRWVSSTHAIRFRMQTDTRGYGHVYQDRYKSKAADDVVHYATLVRYIERNPLEACVVAQAEDWRWSSLRERMSGQYSLIQPGPWSLPDNWLEMVNDDDVDMSQVPSLLGRVSESWRTATAFPEFT